MALLLSLKKKPVVRYERMSALAKKLGEEITVSHLGKSDAMKRSSGLTRLQCRFLCCL